MKQKSENKRSFSSMRVLARWLYSAWQGHRFQAGLNTLLGLLSVALDLTFVWATKQAVDIATGHVENRPLSFAIGLLVAVVVAQILVGLSSRWIRATLGIRAQNRMQERLFARLLNSEWSSLRKFHTGDLLNRMMRDVSDVVSFLTESLPSLVCTLVQFLGAFVFLYIMDKTLACIVVVVIPVFILTSKMYVRKMRELTYEVRETDSKVQSHIQESMQHTLVIKTLERVEFAVGRLASIHALLRRQVVRRTRYSSFSSGLMNSGFAAGYLFTFVWGVMSLQAGTISYGTLIAFVQLVGQVQAPVKSLTRFVPVLIGAFTATERLIDIEKVDLEPQKTPSGHPVLQMQNNGKVGVSLENLTFRYATDSRYIFQNFSFNFPSGSVTAIVGETGTGKTTLVRLLLSLVKPTAGHLYIYNECTQERTPVSATTRSAFTYVPQGNTLLSGTVRDNLRLGNPEASDAEMLEVLHVASADFVGASRLGLDTVCGEMGGGFSEGQAQRICIARALLRHSPILLFDESTSSLDEETEQVVVRRILEYAKGRTLIFVTHRPEVLKYCSQKLRL